VLGLLLGPSAGLYGISGEVPWRLVARRTAVLSRGRHIAKASHCFTQLVAAWRTLLFLKGAAAAAATAAADWRRDDTESISQVSSVEGGLAGIPRQTRFVDTMVPPLPGRHGSTPHVLAEAWDTPLYSRTLAAVAMLSAVTWSKESVFSPDDEGGCMGTVLHSPRSWRNR
jgi:hypothetical protein